MIDLRCGDCLGELRTLADASVDAVVTDPPAGIGFMGQDWDHDRGGRVRWIGWLAERMAECLRVARPGAHALVWALPRTSHLTGVAIEDAGWVIEDRIAHVFGQGFPKHKSKLKPAVEDWWLCTKPGGAKWLNVDGCRIGTRESLGRLNHTTSRYIDSSNGSREPHERTVWVDNSTGKGRWPSNLVLTHHPDCRPCGERRVKNGTGGRFGGDNRRNNIYGKDDRLRGERQSYKDPDGLETVPAWRCVAGCPVAEMDRQSGVSTSKRGGKAGVIGYHSGGHGAERDGHDDTGHASRFFPTFSWTEADLDAQMREFLYCRAMTIKNIMEAWQQEIASIVAGSSTLSSVLVASALSRVAALVSQGEIRLSVAKEHFTSVMPSDLTVLSACVITATLSFADARSQGLPPEMLIRSLSLANGAEIRLLTVTTTTMTVRLTSGGYAADVTLEAMRNNTVHGDPDYPALFNYCPKASRRERNAGLEGIQTEGRQGARPKSPDPSGKFPDHDHRERGGNCHPTVKPLALMRWLCRLITPPGGVILDPFAGSGTSGLAAEAEGFDAVLIERQPEYLEIARRRLAAATAGAPLFAALP